MKNQARERYHLKENGGFIEKLAFEQRHEGNEGEIHVDV